jgi:DNA-binding transcriptional ArsR family regulator
MSQSLQSIELFNGNVPVKVDFVHSKKAALILRSINHKLRQQIIKLLDENQKMTVTEIYVKLRLEQSVASQHLGWNRSDNPRWQIHLLLSQLRPISGSGEVRRNPDCLIFK